MNVFAYGAFEDFEDGFLGHDFVLVVGVYVALMSKFFVLSVTVMMTLFFKMSEISKYFHWQR